MNFSEWSEILIWIYQVIFPLTKFTAFGSISLLRVSNYLYYLSLSKWLVNYYNRVFNNLDHPIVRAQFNHLITQFNASVPPDVKISFLACPVVLCLFSKGFLLSLSTRPSSIIHSKRVTLVSLVCVSGVTHCVYLKHFFWWSIDTPGMCQPCSSVDHFIDAYSVNLINQG